MLAAAMADLWMKIDVPDNMLEVFRDTLGQLRPSFVFLKEAEVVAEAYCLLRADDGDDDD